MSDLEKIKKDYGEKMAHFCRDNFPTILETDGLLYEILSSHFAPNKFLYDDLKYNYDGFKNYICSFFKRNIEEVEVDKTPKELLDEAGYILYECKSEEDIQSFKKYYAKGEELCTFNGDRLDRCHVFFAVKKDVDEIKREDYKKPMRQDKYGTSVISIQFTKGDVNTLSIKNRYNHAVDSPDATFSNDLENIIAGLTKSFEKVYNLKINSSKNSFELPGYTLADDKKFYKYNYEENNIYYCPNNIIIDHGKVITEYIQNERYIVFNYFVLDLKEKKIFLYNKNLTDGFIDRFKKIEKIEVIKDKKTGDKEIKIKTPDGNARIVISDKSIIKEYEDDMEKDIKPKFLYLTKYIESVNLPNVKNIGNLFLMHNLCLKKLNIPNVINIGTGFLRNNNSLEEADFPSVINIGDGFLEYNTCLKEANFPNLENIGDGFLQSNECIDFVYLPNALKIGSSCLLRNEIITEFIAPKVSEVHKLFLRNCTKIKKIYLNSVLLIGDYSLTKAKDLNEIYMPNVIGIGDSVLKENNGAIELNLPNVKRIGYDFLKINNSLKRIYIPSIVEIGSGFLLCNTTLEELVMPDNVDVGAHFLDEHPKFSRRESRILSDANGNKIRFY